MSLNLITAPVAAVLIPEDMSNHLRADITADSALIAIYIAAITAKAEAYLRRALVTQTWELSLDMFPYSACGSIRLPLSPVQTITSIKYIGMDGVEQTISSADYVLTSDDPNMVVPAYGKIWPYARFQPGAVKIRYVVGYGDLGTGVPEAIRVWIMMNVANLYENRETIIVGKNGFADLSTMSDSLLDSYRLVTF